MRAGVLQNVRMFGEWWENRWSLVVNCAASPSLCDEPSFLLTTDYFFQQPLTEHHQMIAIGVEVV